MKNLPNSLNRMIREFLMRMKMTDKEVIELQQKAITNLEEQADLLKRIIVCYINELPEGKF
jgi:hypothetical protein